MVTTRTYHRISLNYDLSSRFGSTLTGNRVPWRTSECAQLTFLTMRNSFPSTKIVRRWEVGREFNAKTVLI
jgi:hypothetical protein